MEIFAREGPTVGASGRDPPEVKGIGAPFGSLRSSRGMSADISVLVALLGKVKGGPQWRPRLRNGISQPRLLPCRFRLDGGSRERKRVFAKAVGEGSKRPTVPFRSSLLT